MSKIDKKKFKIISNIKKLEEEMLSSLSNKSSNFNEISISSYMKKIQDLKKQLEQLKIPV